MMVTTDDLFAKEPPTWRGRKLEDMTREELIAVIQHLTAQLRPPNFSRKQPERHETYAATGQPMPYKPADGWEK